MLTDEEIRDIRNRAKLNDNRQIDPLAFARDIERAVLGKLAGKQEPIFIGRWDDDARFSPINFVEGLVRSSIPNGTAIYAHSIPAQSAAIPEGYCLAPKEPTASMLDAGVAMALQVSVHGEGGWSKYLSGLYRQMLSAPPKP